MIWQKWYAFNVLVFYHSNMLSFTLFQTSLCWTSAIMINYSYWIFLGSVDSFVEATRPLVVLKNNTQQQQQWWQTQTECSWSDPLVIGVRQEVMWKAGSVFFFCEQISCIGDFLYFCMRCLALISLPMRRASVCGFLHEANVAVDFSSSSLSLCDIVYREKIIQMWTKFLFYFLFQKRILWYGLLLPFVMILMKSSCFFFLFCSSFFLSYRLLKSFAFYSLLSFFSMMFAKHRWEFWHVPHTETPISVVMWGALLRFSQRDCHSYNSGNPIGPEHQCIPPAHITPLVSQPPSVCACVCAFECVY